MALDRLLFAALTLTRSRTDWSSRCIESSAADVSFLFSLRLSRCFTDRMYPQRCTLGRDLRPTASPLQLDCGLRRAVPGEHMRAQRCEELRTSVRLASLQNATTQRGRRKNTR